jgi:hypothetical protein
MKNTRKKMLLSSVAMLLVALVALGSATYAWFSISKTVSANGIQVKAVTESGLAISIHKDSSKAWDQWSESSVTYTGEATDKNLVSCDTVTKAGTDVETTDLNGFFPGSVTHAEGGTWTADNTKVTDFKSVNTPAGAAQDVSDVLGAMPDTSAQVSVINKTYFAAYGVAVKSASSVTRNNVTAKINITQPSGVAANGVNIARVALIDEDGKVLATYGVTESNAKAVESVTSGVPTMVNQSLTNSGTATTVASTLGATEKSFTMLVWMEGEDADAVNAASGIAANIAIEFEYAY